MKIFIKGVIILQFLYQKASIEVREAGKRAVSQFHNSNSSQSLPSHQLVKEDEEEDGITKKSNCSQNETASKLTETNANKIMKGNTKQDLLENDKYITILHYNDVYNIDSNISLEPIGGAARFCTAMKTFNYLNPIVLFSGDVFSPSMRKFNCLIIKIESLIFIYYF